MTAKTRSRPPDPSWLTASQTAARLGLKPATLYAYVSRGLIPRHRGADGRTSFFDPADVERLAKRTPHSRLAPTDIVVPTAISLVDPERDIIWYRGVDAIEASRAHRFEAVAEFLWTGRWNADAIWEADPTTLQAAQRAQRGLPRSTPAVDRIGVIVAAARAADRERSEGSVESAIRIAQSLLATIVGALPLHGTDPRMAVKPERNTTFSQRLWARITSKEPDLSKIRALDTLLGLSVEHGVTLPVVAARVAASSGADLYAAITASLCVNRGHEPRIEAREQAIAEALASTGLDEPASLELIGVIAQIAGWIAHAIAEQRQPTPFRPHATYTGTMPVPEPRDERPLLHAVQSYLRDD